MRACVALFALSLTTACHRDVVRQAPEPRGVTQETAKGPYRKVVRVVDGDTIVVAKDGTVRLLGIDAPELHHPSKPVGRCGVEARALVVKLIEGTAVRLSTSGRTFDRYNRRLAYVWVDSTLLQNELLKTGMATVYGGVSYHARKTAFAALEAEAKAAHRGVWGTDQHECAAVQ